MIRRWLPINALLSLARIAGLHPDIKLRKSDAEAVGRVLQSGLFDADWYGRQVSGIRKRTPELLARHYLTQGADQGLDPGPAFDARTYAFEVPGVARARLNPLLHYLHRGKRQARRLFPAPPPVSPGPVPPPESWSAALLPRSGTTGTVAVDVVVPVYGAFDETLACLWTVLNSIDSTLCELVVVDDCSPEPALSAALRSLEGQGLIALLVNPRNRGFVHTANRGLARRADRDVVLLNSDTLVYGDWVERLRAQAYARPRVASVTPLSNNATICSYPYINRRNPGTLAGLGPRELDALAAAANRGEAVEVPTSVGFCVYLTRGGLQAVGYLDEEAFGRGYGEENDLSRRAVAGGWINLLAGDVYVHHHGGVSFAGDAAEELKQGMAALLARHPDYLDAVRAHISEDPARPIRASLDVAVMANGAAGPAVLLVAHAKGGGTERLVLERARKLEQEGSPAYILRPHEGGRVSVERAGRPPLPNVNPLDWPADHARLEQLLLRLGVRHIQVHHLSGAPEGLASWLVKFAKAVPASLHVTLHDYHWVCPRITLTRANGEFCGAPQNPARCNACIRRGARTEAGSETVQSWRNRFLPLIDAADRIEVPDPSMGGLLARLHLPRAEAICVTPHHAVELPELPELPRPHVGTPRRIAVLGAISTAKGSGVLVKVARYAARRRLPLEFVIIGYTNRDSVLRRLPNVSITGPYRDEDITHKIKESGAAIAFFPGQYPETFCFTLSSALASGLLPVGFDVGAVASRIRQYGRGCVLPLTLADRPKLLAERLCAITAADSVQPRSGLE